MQRTLLISALQLPPYLKIEDEYTVIKSAFYFLMKMDISMYQSQECPTLKNTTYYHAHLTEKR